MLKVAIDVGPLHGHRTGVGEAVAGMAAALGECDEIHVTRYLTSTRAKLAAGERRLPLPAAAAHRMWARTDWPPLDRFLADPDVVHGTNYVVPPTRCPGVVSVYDCWFLEHPGDSSPDVRRAGAALRRAVAGGAHVVTSSGATTTKARQLLDTDRVTTIHLGPPASSEVPTDVPARLRQLADPFVLALGTLERRKDIAGLVNAFAHLAGEHPTVELVLAGAPGDDARRVATAIDRLHTSIRSRVRRLGVISDDEKSWLLAHTAVLAYPSLDEGFGFPILEAQQAGAPVVATSVGSVREVGGSAVLLVPPGDPHALAANLYWMVTNPAMRTRMVERGHRNVARFSWSSTASQLVDHYRHVVEQQ